jgi:DNA-binding response OmpR family regulator
MAVSLPDILVVDDNHYLTQLLRYILEPMGYGVRVAADGRSALREVARSVPDLAIIDLKLPDMDGMELCNTVHRRFGTPLVTLSSRTDDPHRHKLQQMGLADNDLLKPFQPDELVDMVQAVLTTVRPGQLRVH